ncbi:hypothetical protein BGZ83_006929 [Gryganskiella cystojenkinii]|nr:hypothetical protein BGZ83_006929 [Gryganskiella cystojenkinii]
MASTDEILSIVALALFAALLGPFIIRLVRTKWVPYGFLSFFCILRVVAYSIRVYTDTLEIGSSKWISLYSAQASMLSIGVIFELVLLSQLYQSILPKLRAQAGEPQDQFERSLVDRARMTMLPVIILLILGGVWTGNPDKEETALVLKKVGILLLGVIGAFYLYAAIKYRRKYPDHKFAFNIALAVTILFDISLIYKIVITFDPEAAKHTIVYFLLSPLLELIALAFLSVNLRKYFLGGKLPTDEATHEMTA